MYDQYTWPNYLDQTLLVEPSVWVQHLRPYTDHLLMFIDTSDPVSTWYYPLDTIKFAIEVFYRKENTKYTF